MADYQLVKNIGNPVQLVFSNGGINFRRVYNSGTAYSTGDSVSYLGSSYVAVQSTTGNIPTDETYWQVLASKGDKGERGIQGPIGPSSAIPDLTQLNFSTFPATDHSVLGYQTNIFAAGTSISAGKLVILNSSSQWVLTDANSESIYKGLLGIALEDGTTGNLMSTALPGSFVRDDSWSWDVGEMLYVSETAGEITDTQPTTSDATIRTVGYAVSEDVIWFYPSPDYATHI